MSGVGEIAGRTKPAVRVALTRHGRIQLATVHLAVETLPEAFEGYRILQLTDLHFGPVTPIDLITEAVELGCNLKPDLVALTGDFVQISSTGAYHILATRLHPRMFRWVEYRRQVREYTEQLSSVLDPLRGVDGRIGIFGNHDYTEGIGTIKRKLGRDIRWLINDSLDIERGSEQLCIAGVDDLRYGEPDLERTFARYSEPSLTAPPVCVLLAHNPDVVLFRKNELLQHCSLILSGHTHGGQICLPGVRPLVTRTRQKKHVRGLTWFKQTPIYVANGVGFGGIRIRSFCPPEIVIVQLGRRLP